MKERGLRRWLIFWTLFICLGALAGSVGMLIDPSGRAMGMDAMLPFFQVLPFAEQLFQNFVFSGIALLCVNCIPQLAVFFLLMRKQTAKAAMGGIVCGTLLMLWICIQFVIFPLNFMSTAYFIFGALEFVCALLLRKTVKA